MTPSSSTRRGLIAAVAASMIAGPLALTSAAQASPEPATPAALLRYTGDASSATGAALTTGDCDVNDDGYADVITGAWFWDKAGAANTGATYVMLGGPEVTGTTLADPTAANAVRIDGPAVASSFTGFAVGCLGDVNGDGIDDLAISHYTQNKAYVLFGAPEFTAVDLGSLGDRGFVVKGNATSGNVGFSMAGVGDLDNDGREDFGIAEIVADTRGRTNNGRVWIIAGRDDISDVDLLAPTDGQVLLTVDGATAEERLGNVANVGDVNGDGTDDLLLGSYTSTPWGAGIAVPGAAYVVWGGGEDSAVDLASLGNRGFKVFGPKRQRDRLGISVSGAGDVNGDDKADLVIGADGVANADTGPRNGGAAVVLGSASSATVYTDPVATTSVYSCSNDPGTGTCADPFDVRKRGYWITGATASDAAGYAVAGLGDVNGDGVPDQLIGAYGYDPLNPETQTPMSGAGAAYVVFGNKVPSNVSLGSLTDATGYRINGLKAGDRFGRQVAGLGDVDGNGVDDFAAGADFASRPGAQNGEVVVALLGTLASSTALSTPSASLQPGDTVTATATVARNAGPAIAPAGTVDFTRDGAAICTEVPVIDGAATCTLALTSKGASSLVATYGGTDQLAGSTSSAVAIDVAGFATTVTPDTTAPSTYGEKLSLAATVAGSGPAPTGTVTFKAGSQTLGTKPVAADGSVSLTVAAFKVQPGQRTITITYAGDSTHAGSATTTVAGIAKAGAQIAFSLQNSILKAGTAGKADVEVVTPDGVPARGAVVVLDGGKVIKTVAWNNPAGQRTMTLPKLARGQHRIQVRFTGSTVVADRTSAVAKLRVR